MLAIEYDACNIGMIYDPIAWHTTLELNANMQSLRSSAETSART